MKHDNNIYDYIYDYIELANSDVLYSKWPKILDNAVSDNPFEYFRQRGIDRTIYSILDKFWNVRSAKERTFPL